MADNSPIEWTDATWNIVTGCDVISPGCTNCYAMRLAGTRLRSHPSRTGLTRETKAGPVWTGDVRFNAQWLDQPRRWKRPRMIFVAAHGDLFHPGVTEAQLDQIFAVMALCPQHTFQVLTKRPERARAYLTRATGEGLQDVQNHLAWTVVPDVANRLLPGWRNEGVAGAKRGRVIQAAATWPLPNVWLGTSVEDQKRAFERIPHLLDTPAAVRWISAEPLLGPLSIENYLREYPMEGRLGRLDWVVAGGESQAGARPMHPDWARSLRDQCAAAGVPFLFKQWGSWIDADQIAARLTDPAADVFITKDGERWRPTLPLNFEDAAWLANIIGRDPEHQSDGRTLFRMSKADAGRLLDGVEHNGMPK